MTVKDVTSITYYSFKFRDVRQASINQLYCLLKWSSIIAQNDNRHIINNSTLPTAAGNNERPIVQGIGGGSIQSVLQLSIKQHQGSHHGLNEHNIYTENVKTNTAVHVVGGRELHQTCRRPWWLSGTLFGLFSFRGGRTVDARVGVRSCRGTVCCGQQWSLDALVNPAEDVTYSQHLDNISQTSVDHQVLIKFHKPTIDYEETDWV